jgi:phosphohistidine phosphatase SixA
MGRLRPVLALLCLGLFVAAPADAAERQDSFRLFLVRHAERADGSADPPLSPAGERRASRLAESLAARGIEAVWSSDYRRTLNTAMPLAARLGLGISTYDPLALAEFSQTLIRLGQNAMVVGHSNTTPELAALLCGCPVEPMGHDEYDRLLIIAVDETGPRLVERRQAQPDHDGPRP